MFAKGLVVLCVLGSCRPTPKSVPAPTTPEAASRATPDASMSEANDASASPRATATPAATGSAVAINVSPGVSLGGIRVGMSRDEVGRLFGVPPGYDGGGFYIYLERGLDVVFNTDSRVHAIHAYGRIPSGYEKAGRQAFDLRAAKGISFASTYDDVIAAYGHPDRQSDNVDAPLPQRSITYRGIKLDFVLKTGQLSHVVVTNPE